MLGKDYMLAIIIVNYDGRYTNAPALVSSLSLLPASLLGVAIVWVGGTEEFLYIYLHESLPVVHMVRCSLSSGLQVLCHPSVRALF